MATDLGTPEREAAADRRRIEALERGTLTSIRVMTGDEEGVVIPLTEDEGYDVMNLVSDLLRDRNKPAAKPPAKK